MKRAFSVEVDLPDGISDYEVESAVLGALDDLRDDYERRCWRQEASAGKYNDELADTNGYSGRKTAIVSAKTYDRVVPDQELGHLDGPDRPVLMRGSLFYLMEARQFSNTTAPTVWIVDVVERYLRKIKFTCFDSKECLKFLQELLGRLYDKHNLRHSLAIYNRIYSVDFMADDSCWINGKYCEYLSQSQVSHLRGLYSILKRTRKLEKRRALLLRDMNERLAA